MIKRTLFFGNPAYLSTRNEQLVVKLTDPNTQEEVVKTIPIEDVGVVVLEDRQITITNGAMDALLHNNCAVVTCDEKHMPAGLLLPLEGHSVQSERFRWQIEASLPLKKQLWQQTIKQKILNQAEILRKESLIESRCMEAWAKDVRSGDFDNLEARAAAYYWKNVFAPWGIKDFVRGRDEAPPNNLLNYGYAILRAIIARALVGSGLLPTLGIHHHNRYNAYALADDIMEPYRPFVDKKVLEIVKSGIDYTELSRDIKGTLLTLPTMDVIINEQRSPLMIAASTTTASLAKCYGGESRKLIYPEMP